MSLLSSLLLTVQDQPTGTSKGGEPCNQSSDYVADLPSYHMHKADNGHKCHHAHTINIGQIIRSYLYQDGWSKKVQDVIRQNHTAR